MKTQNKASGSKKGLLIVLLILIIVVALGFFIRSLTRSATPVPKVAPGQTFKELITPPPTK